MSLLSHPINIWHAARYEVPTEGAILVFVAGVGEIEKVVLYQQVGACLGPTERGVGRKGWQRAGERLAKGWHKVGEGLAKG